jgi:hypothetical protein
MAAAVRHAQQLPATFEVNPRPFGCFLRDCCLVFAFTFTTTGAAWTLGFAAALVAIVMGLTVLRRSTDPLIAKIGPLSLKAPPPYFCTIVGVVAAVFCGQRVAQEINQAPSRPHAYCPSDRRVDPWEPPMSLAPEPGTGRHPSDGAACVNESDTLELFNGMVKFSTGPVESGVIHRPRLRAGVEIAGQFRWAVCGATSLQTGDTLAVQLERPARRNQDSELNSEAVILTVDRVARHSAWTYATYNRYSSDDTPDDTKICLKNGRELRRRVASTG